MDKLKVAFLDFWPEIKDENVFLPILKKYFDVEINTTNPDVIFHSIFGGMRETPKYKCKKILFLGENHRPSNYETTYSISFDTQTETNYRLPLWQFYLLLYPEQREKLFGERINHKEFSRFCSFVVSNPTNFIRNSFFHQLSSFDQSFGQVYSYGRYLCNDYGLQAYSNARYWRDAKYDFFNNHPHKFAIAFENNSYPYYCTEKLMDAFLAGSLPLYWGDPYISQDWKPDAFINVMKLGTDDTLKLIKEMQNNQALFDEMYKQPIFTEEQRKRHINNMDGFENWLIEKIKK
jgi:alpha(1,3/1,4) fucosyltransferase